MIENQSERFKYGNDVDPKEAEQMSNSGVRNRNSNTFQSNLIENFDSEMHGQILEIAETNSKNLNLDNQDHENFAVSKQYQEQQVKLDRKIKKLTALNKSLIETLKDQNEQITRKVEKQKFKPAKVNRSKSIGKSFNSKQIESLRRELENSYRQIDYYINTISLLKCKSEPIENQEKENEFKSKLREKNDLIGRLQSEIATKKAIKAQQEKELNKIHNEDVQLREKETDKQIEDAKKQLKLAKLNLAKREELQKKQHMYLTEIEKLIRRHRKDQQKQQNEADEKAEKEEQITELQWEETRYRFLELKKRYEENRKKMTYLNYMKSKSNKEFEETELKYKEKVRNYQKLTSKLNEVVKLGKSRKSASLSHIDEEHRTSVNMAKLQDIISRQSTIDLLNNDTQRGSVSNKAKVRIRGRNETFLLNDNEPKAGSMSENPRDFKRWHVEGLNSQIGTSPKEQVGQD